MRPPSAPVDKVEAPLDTTFAIEAPEQIRFHFRLAGPAQRLLAYFIDVVILVVGFVLVGIVLFLTLSSFAAWFNSDRALENAGQGVILVVLFLAEWGYFALFEGFVSGQTPGKRIMSLRVVKIGGEPIGFIDAALRNLLRAADGFPFIPGPVPIGLYGAALVSAVVDSKFRRLGDLVAGTVVVVEDSVSVAVPLHIDPPTADESASLPSRIALDAEELRAVEMFLNRAPKLGPALAAELSRNVAQMLGKKYGVHHANPARLLALLYLRATAPIGSHNTPPGRSLASASQGAQ